MSMRRTSFAGHVEFHQRCRRILRGGDTVRMGAPRWRARARQRHRPRAGHSGQVPPFLFQKCSQAAPPLARRTEGSGLGLCISKQLAERMGGRIGVDTEEGAGSTFWIELPAAFAGREALLQPQSASWLGTKTGRLSGMFSIGVASVHRAAAACRRVSRPSEGLRHARASSLRCHADVLERDRDPRDCHTAETDLRSPRSDQFGSEECESRTATTSSRQPSNPTR